MSVEQLSKKQLKWQCRRGMLELDVLLDGYLEKQYQQLDDDKKQRFNQLLGCTDPEIFAWIVKQETVPEKFVELIDDIKADH